MSTTKTQVSTEQVMALLHEIEHADQLRGPDAIAQITRQVAELRTVIGPWLGVQRARLCADEYCLRGTRLREIAERERISHNTVALWLQEYGPDKYLTLRQEDTGDGPTVVPELVDANPKVIGRLLAVGRRVAPATLGLYDNTTGLLDGLDLDALWTQLAGQG